jgi:TonB family protein
LATPVPVIAEDTTMTSRPTLVVASLVVFLAAVVAVAVAAAQELPPSAGQGWQLAGAFPQSQPGPLERSAKPVTPENPIPRRTRVVRPPYPPEAAVVGARANVRLRVTIDHLGTVGEVRELGGPLLGAVAPDSPSEQAFSAGLLALVRSAKDAVAQWLYEPPADAPMAFDVVIGFTTQADGEVIAQSSSSAPASPDAEPSAGDSATRRTATKVKHVSPIYPPAARDAKISGVVVLQVTIGADGRVLDAQVMRSIPELDQAALDAVRQWEYVPQLVNGEPTPFTMAATIQFSLGNEATRCVGRC